MSRRYEPTPEDLAKAEQRRLKKEQAKEQVKKEPLEDERGRILPRQWLEVSTLPIASDSQSVIVMTWNLLAQALVRRELFPTSDCLKASQREHMLYRELLSHNADICCLQEVDRTDKLFPELRKGNYAWVYAAGPRKKHGCLIAYRQDVYQCVRQQVITYDDQEIRDADSEKARRGSSFRTKNIASIVALRKVGSENVGVIVATTHLFWHPAYTYERARQAAILLREVTAFRSEGSEAEQEWSSIVAGDFNCPPDDPTYSLLVGDSLLAEQEKRLAISRVVHASLDSGIRKDVPAADEDEGAEGGENDPDRIIVNARVAQPADGLLTDAELEKLFRQSGALRSAYDLGMRSVPAMAGSELTFGSRVQLPAGRRGSFEPAYTSYTHYWQSVLDYIFVLDPPGRSVSVARLALPHRAEMFGGGLPRKGVCGSDHVSLAADLYWTTT